MYAAKKILSLSSLWWADPFIAEPVFLNAGQNSQLKPNETSVSTRRMRGHDGDAFSRAKGKKRQAAFFQNRRVL